MNPEAITTLIEANRYNLEILPKLEQYVSHQVDTKTYHFEANLTVLKLYQFHPEKFNKTIVGKILAKALMNLPANDFLLCSYLIPERFTTEEPISSLNTLSNHLETAHFGEFWTESKTCRELLDSVPGFDDAIRSFIIGVLSQTYKTIPKEAATEVINLKGAELDALISSKGWEQTPEAVVFPKADIGLTQTKKKMAQNVKYDDLSRILKSLSK